MTIYVVMHTYAMHDVKHVWIHEWNIIMGAGLDWWCTTFALCTTCY